MKDKELVDRHFKLLQKTVCKEDSILIEMAKDHTLICVDEDIKTLKKIKHPMNSARTNRRIEREILKLEEVKQEIEKL